MPSPDPHHGLWTSPETVLLQRAASDIHHADQGATSIFIITANRENYHLATYFFILLVIHFETSLSLIQRSINRTPHIHLLTGSQIRETDLRIVY